jgi:hypothetical protein
MAQEVDDAIGQLVRQCCWIQEARVEVCTPSGQAKAIDMDSRHRRDVYEDFAELC